MPRYTEERYCHNLNIVQLPTTGDYDIPIIAPEKWKQYDWIGFNYAKTCTNREQTGIHFFVDDYQFERMWQYVSRYTKLLTQFGAIMSPDYSMFTDWPVSIQIYNHYRKHFWGAYLQFLGVTVYPTITWSDHSSYSWCFDGEPKNAVVCISSVGTQLNTKTKELFLDGYFAMVDVLTPKTIVFHGDIPDEIKDRNNIIQIPTFREGVRRRTVC